MSKYSERSSTSPIMTPGASSSCPKKPQPKSPKSSKTTTGKGKSSRRASSTPHKSGGTGMVGSGSMPRGTAAEDFLNPHHPVSLGASAASVAPPVGTTNQGQGPGSAASSAPPALSQLQLQAPVRHESQWDEGTVYGRIASMNYQPGIPYDRDPVYCDRAAQAISDFEKKI